MHIEIDKDRCIASGACVLAAPAIFDQDDDGIVEVIVSDPAPNQEKEAAAGIRACPAAAIWDE
ncbi:ferredoxin [Nocardia noduli]|uniref:ferredoxin n=1 Tax=Nocardia noduli TaxID=2815722 RepID=UPI001C24EDEF|nr:ferredoxin [Nocardia noduli]